MRIRVKKLSRVLILVLFLAFFLMQIGFAENSPELLMDSAHNAAFKFKQTKPEKDVNGTFNFATDLAKGMSVGKVDLKFGDKAQKEVGDAKGALFYTVGAVLEMIGNIDFTIPESEKTGDLPKEGTLDIESVLSESAAYAKGKFDIAVKAADKVPKINIDGKMDGNPKNFNTDVTYAVEVGPEAQQFPVKSLDVNISEKADKETATTLVVKITTDPKSPIAPQVTMMGKTPDQVTGPIKNGLGSLGVQVDKVEVTDFKDAPDVTATLTIGLKDWRGTVAKSLDKAGGKVDQKKLKDSADKMMSLVITSLSIKVNNDGKTISGSVNSKLDNFNKFAEGYYDIIAMVAEQQLKDQEDSTDLQKKMIAAYQLAAFDQARRSLVVASESNMSYKGDFKLEAQMPVDKDGKPGDLKVSGNFNTTMDNFKSYIEKAQAAGLPVGKASAFKMQGTLKDRKLTGSLYANSDAKLLDFYKDLLADTLKKAGVPDDHVKLVKDVQIKGGQSAFTLSKEGIAGSGYLESSDLTPAVKAVLNQLSPNMTGDPLGAEFNFKAEQGNGNLDGAIFFGKLMDGKSKDEITKVVHVPVKEGAKPEEVKLVAVNKPEVAVPSGLTAVQSEGKKLLGGSSGIAAIPGMGGGSTGGLPTGLIALGGVAVLGVIGGAMLMGGKKSA